MDIKKILLAGSAVTAMVLATSCSSDKSTEPDPTDPTISSSSEGGVNPGSSGDPVTGSSSSVGNGGPSDPTQSSSSEVVDESVTQMAITEIMYNAADASALEWIEITIQSGPDISSMLASQMRLDGALSFTFPNEALKKGEYIVVTNDPELFKTTYPTFNGRLYGPWDKDPKTGAIAKLSNEGDVIDVKLMGEGDVSCSYSMEPPWPSLANGKGRTLVYKGGNAAQATSWGASKVMGGNPGAGNDEWLTTSNIRLNEIMPTGTGTDAWVELYNAGDAAVDVTGWIFESKIRKEKLSIKAGTVPAKGYLVLKAAEDFMDKDGTAAVELIVSDIGGSYYLYGATEGDESSLLLPSSKLSSGVIDLSDGSTAQGALVTATPGEPNSTLYIGSLVITEINYHPNEDDLNDVEFLELKNVSETPITPYEKLTSGNRGWKIEGINFEFLPTDVIPAGGLVVLFPDSLKTALGAEKLRTRYSIDAGVVISFYTGKLSNRGEMIAVKKPYFLQKGETSFDDQWYYDWSDATLYSDKWSGNGVEYKRADGYGYSLQRKDFTTMGYEASAWTVGEPTPGK